MVKEGGYISKQMSEIDDYDVFYLHSQLTKYVSKMQEEKEKMTEKIKKYIHKLNTKHLPYGADITQFYTYCKQYSIKLIEESKKQGKLTYKEWTDTIEEIKKIEYNYEEVDIHFPFLFVSVEPILTLYTTELKQPVVSQFVKGKQAQENEACKTYYEEYCSKCIDILGEERFYSIVKRQPKLTIQSISSLCMNTSMVNSTSSQESDDFKEDYKVQYDDIGRVNLNQKYKYERKCHFRDTLQQFQALQNKQISERVYQDIEEMANKFSLLDLQYTDKRRFKKITQDHIRVFLNELEYTDYYEDTQLIYTTLTGKPAPNISKYEKELYNDFDQLVNAYLQLPEKVRKNRKNFLNNKYVLTQLLNRRGIKVPEADLNCLRTPSRLKEHDEIYSMCCDILEWKFSPLA